MQFATIEVYVRGYPVHDDDWDTLLGELDADAIKKAIKRLVSQKYREYIHVNVKYRDE